TRYRSVVKSTALMNCGTLPKKPQWLTACKQFQHVPPHKATNVYSSEWDPRSALRTNVPGTIRRRQRGTRRRDAVFDPRAELRRPGTKRLVDGYRHRRIKPLR